MEKSIILKEFKGSSMPILDYYVKHTYAWWYNDRFGNEQIFGICHSNQYSKESHLHYFNNPIYLN